jgi:hypothetical protein
MFSPPLNKAIFPLFLGKASEGIFKDQFLCCFSIAEHAEIVEGFLFFFLSGLRDLCGKFFSFEP